MHGFISGVRSSAPVRSPRFRQEGLELSDRSSGALEELRGLFTLRLGLRVAREAIEARLLTPEADSLNAAAQELLSYGCEFVLLTGTHDRSPEIVHRLYSDRRLVQSFYCERLAGSYHGSGCTLSSAIAALLGHGLDPLAAVGAALDYTLGTLKHATPLGSGQLIPDRFFRSRRIPHA